MEIRLTRTTNLACRTCRSSWIKRTAKVRPAHALSQSRESSTKAKISPRSNPIIHRQTPSKFVTALSESSPSRSRNAQPDARLGRPPTEDEIRQVQKLSEVVFKHSSIPSEEQVVAALQAIEHVAQNVAGIPQQPDVSPAKEDDTPASALLSLDATSVPQSQTQQHSSTETIDILSNTAYKLLIHPPVFITPSILNTYVVVQSLLLRPATFPEIFTLYSTKPIPTPSEVKSTPAISYKSQSPTAISTAIPSGTAALALSAAIQSHSLGLALSIISSTYSTVSFQRSKVFRRALPPAMAASLAPLAAYSVATTLSTYQTALPPESFTSIAFAGLLTYTTAVGTIGYVALTTSNDQMERVTWAVGLPLWERWVREDERAALDRIVLAWGFKERWRWGEEEGAEWDGLKEWAGLRGMVVDKVGLMEGME